MRMICPDETIMFIEQRCKIIKNEKKKLDKLQQEKKILEEELREIDKKIKKQTNTLRGDKISLMSWCKKYVKGTVNINFIDINYLS